MNVTKSDIMMSLLVTFFLLNSYSLLLGGIPIRKIFMHVFMLTDYVYVSGVGYISPEPIYIDRGDLSAPVIDVDPSIKDQTDQSVLDVSHKSIPDTPLLRLRNGALQAGLKDRLERIVAKRKVSIVHFDVNNIQVVFINFFHSTGCVITVVHK